MQTPTPSLDADVLVVGAGPTGLTLASELLSRGVRCRIIDKVTDFPDTTRAHGLQPRTLEGFDRMGIVDQMLATGTSDSLVRIYARGKPIVTLDLHTDPRPDAPYLSVLLTRQPNVERVLRERVTALGGVIERGCELVDLDDDGAAITATVDEPVGGRTRQLRAKYVVGCDGGHSIVRRLLGLSFEGETTATHYVLGDMQVEWDLPPATSRIWLHPNGWIAAGVFPGSSVWNLTADIQPGANGQVEPASAALFERLLHERTGVATARVTKTWWLSNYTVNRRMVNHYRRGRAFVAGDAAHVHSPAGGQGMNTGIQDAFNLGWKLDLVVRGKARESLLDTYEEERQPVAHELLSTSSMFGSGSEAMFSSGAVASLLRDHVIMPLLSHSRVRSELLLRLAQLDIAYPESSLTQRAPSTGLGEVLRLSRAPRPGDRAPDAPGRDARTGSRKTLFDVFRGPHFTLLLFAPRASLALVELAREVREELGGDIRICLVTTTPGLPDQDWSDGVLVDSSGEAHRIYGATDEAVYLVRPDGYVAFRGDASSSGQLHEYLKRILLPPTLAARAAKVAMVKGVRS